MVRFGPKCPKGFLPVFSVNTAAEAEDLLILACPRNDAGEFVAPDLAQEQSLENLYKFGDRLRKAYEFLIKNRETNKEKTDGKDDV